MYNLLKAIREFDWRIFNGILFHITGPEYASDFLQNSRRGCGTYRGWFESDRKDMLSDSLNRFDMYSYIYKSCLFIDDAVMEFHPFQFLK